MTRSPAGGFRLIILLLALAAAGKAVLYDTMDPDCFWHLRVAAQLHRDGIGPLVDNLSFASSRKPWTPYSWLAELGMKAIWDAGGYRAAVATQALMQGAFALLLAAACLQLRQSRAVSDIGPPRPQRDLHEDYVDLLERSGSDFYFSTALCTAAGLFLSLGYLSFRPVTLGLDLLLVCVVLILRDRRLGEQTKSLWLTVPITVLFTNVHLFAMLLPAIGIALLVGAISETTTDRPRRVRRYAVLSTQLVLAFMATPMLPGLVRTIFFYGTRDTMVRGPVIAEMQFFARGPAGAVGAAIVLASTIGVLARWRWIRLAERICFVFATLLLLKMGRFAPVYVMIGMPLLAATMPPLRDRVLAGRPAQWAMASLLLIGCVRVIASFPSRSMSFGSWLNRHGPEAPGYPVAAADYLTANVPLRSGRLVNEFGWGGYLSWRLGDSYRMLLDGRTQVYPAKLWQATYLGTAGDRRALLSTVDADAAVLPTERSEFAACLRTLGWKTVYQDDRAVVMRPPAEPAATMAHLDIED